METTGEVCGQVGVGLKVRRQRWERGLCVSPAAAPERREAESHVGRGRRDLATTWGVKASVWQSNRCIMDALMAVERVMQRIEAGSGIAACPGLRSESCASFSPLAISEYFSLWPSRI